MTPMKLNPVQKIAITTLEDNTIDLTSGDNSDIIKRGRPVGNIPLAGSILAEHGFSAVVHVAAGDKTHALIMDFGLSEDVASRNAKTLGMDLTRVEAAVLSHGHRDHFGGVECIGFDISRKGIDLIVHPSAFKPDRFISFGPGLKMPMMSADEKQMQRAGFNVVKSEKPLAFLENQVLFLGEIPRETGFEKGMPNAVCVKDGKEVKDILEDDSAIAMHLEGKGLVILSGCAHSGIINTVRYARKVTGINRVHVVMGGFHLSGPAFEPIIQDTVDAFQSINPDYVVPTHCTGRKAIQAMEKAMPGAFLLNMSGTTLTFPA